VAIPDELGDVGQDLSEASARRPLQETEAVAERPARVTDPAAGLRRIGEEAEAVLPAVHGAWDVSPGARARIVEPRRELRQKLEPPAARVHANVGDVDHGAPASIARTSRRSRWNNGQT
jgi:hypothetical protein